MLEKTKSQISLFLIPVFVIVLYLTEGFFKIIDYSTGEETMILKIIKLSAMVGMCLYLTINKRNSLLLPIILVAFFCIGQLALVNSFKAPIIVAVGKYLYLIIVLLFFKILEINQEQRDKIFKIFEGVILFNSAFILIGFCFDIYIFKTYKGFRFGYDGLLITSSTATYFYIIGLIYLLYKYRQNLFNAPISYVIIISALMVGTKALYFFMVVFFAVYILFFLKTRIKKLILVGFVILTLIAGYFFFFEFGLFNEIRKSKGLFTALFSYRDQLFYENTLPFIESNWNYLNYLFGGINDLTTKSQIDILDVFYFFGILGGVLFLYMFLQIFIKSSIKTPFLILLSLMMFIICFAGNFFTYASIAIYVAILKETINKYEYS